MTALAEDRKTETPKAQETPAFGTKEHLLAGRQLRHTDVEVLGRKYRVRELKQSEVEEISAAVVHQESDAEGKLTSRADTRGYKARTVAYALVHLDMTPLFHNPRVEYEHLNQLTPDVIDVLFQAVDGLSALTRTARDDLGKGSAKATS